MTSDPLTTVRALAAETSTADARRDLDRLTHEQTRLDENEADPDTLRAVVGMERKTHLEMRVALGDRAAHLPIRRTAPLAELSGAALRDELGRVRQDTLALVDALTAASDPALRVWTFGQLVSPHEYVVALLTRLTRLDRLLRGERPDA